MKKQTGTRNTEGDMDLSKLKIIEEKIGGDIVDIITDAIKTESRYKKKDRRSGPKETTATEVSVHLREAFAKIQKIVDSNAERRDHQDFEAITACCYYWMGDAKSDCCLYKEALEAFALSYGAYTRSIEKHSERKYAWYYHVDRAEVNITLGVTYDKLPADQVRSLVTSNGERTLDDNEDPSDKCYARAAEDFTTAIEIAKKNQAASSEMWGIYEKQLNFYCKCNFYCSALNINAPEKIYNAILEALEFLNNPETVLLDKERFKKDVQKKDKSFVEQLEKEIKELPDADEGSQWAVKDHQWMLSICNVLIKIEHDPNPGISAIYNRIASEAFYRRASGYWYLEEWDSAIRDYEKTLEILQQQSASADVAQKIGILRSLAKTHEGLGDTYQEIKNFESVIRHYQNAKQILEENGKEENREKLLDLYFKIAKTYSESGQNLLAKYYAEKANELDANDPDIWALLGKINSPAAEESSTVSNMEVESAPTSRPAAASSTADAEEERPLSSDEARVILLSALSDFCKAVELDPTNPRFHEKCGDLYCELGDYLKGSESYGKATLFDFDNDALHLKHSKALTRYHQTQQARQQTSSSLEPMSMFSSRPGALRSFAPDADHLLREGVETELAMTEENPNRRQRRV